MRKLRLMLGALVAFLLFAGILIHESPTIHGGTSSLRKDWSGQLQGVIVLRVESPLALVDGKETKLDAGNDFITPLLIEGRVMLPLRFIAENLGWSVEWSEETEQVTLRDEQLEIRLRLGEKHFWLNNESIALEQPATKFRDRTHIPLRAVSEAFGKKVHYESKIVVIADKDVYIDFNKDRIMWDQVRESINTLPVIGNEENFRNLLVQSSGLGDYRVSNEIMKQAESVDSTQGQTGDSSADTPYSQTNLQVQGVDEADTVKTDGKYIYQVSGQKVLISQAYPAEAMKVQGVLNYEKTDYTPRELYVDQNYLVVIGNSVNGRVYPYDEAISNKRLRPDYYVDTKVQALIYDIKDKNNIKKIREVETEGAYLSSRKIGNSLYLLSKKYIDNYRIREPIILPTYRDTALQADPVEIPLTEIRCIPPVLQPNYLFIAGLDLAQPEKEAQITTYLGSGDNVYMSEKNLYVAVQEHSGFYPLRIGLLEESTARKDLEKTLVYKFALQEGQVVYQNKGEVPGRVLNQFSMDEYQDNFRIATTTGYSWQSGSDSSGNHLYVLDNSLSIIGRLEDIAPGEQIYSTRFMGERAYMVTFKNIDPLFVIDLQNPRNPIILGALKIPGYSDYLHPYDANHLIGFGKDTVEVPYKDRQGKVLGTNAYYLGMKLSLFDVTDVANPKELFSEKIGDRGTYSDILNNHKALLFDKASGLLSFPVSLYEVPAEDNISRDNGIPAYGQFTFQGAYVYKLNLSEGFSLGGRITHLTNEDYQKSGYSRARTDKEVKRILYIGENLYTLSEDQIMAHDLPSLKFKHKLPLP